MAKKEDRDAISKIRKNYDFIYGIFNECEKLAVHNLHELEELHELEILCLNERIRYKLLRKKYCLNSKQKIEEIKSINDKDTDEKIEILNKTKFFVINDNDTHEDVKEKINKFQQFKISRIYKKDVEEIMKKLKSILLDYAHYEKK